MKDDDRKPLSVDDALAELGKLDRYGDDDYWDKVEILLQRVHDHGWHRDHI